MAEEDAREAGEDPVVTRARKRFEQAVEAEDENRTKQLDDMRFLASTPDDNFQWPTEILRMRQKPGEEGGIRPCLTINKMRPHQRQVTNEQRLNRPQITARPADSRASVEVAKVLNGWLRHVQVASEADLAYDIACDWQTGGGEGFFRMYTAYADEMSFEQEVVFEPCADRFKVYLDPIGLRLHPAGKKCKWGFIVEDLPKDEYEAEYGKENELDWNEAGAGDQKHWFPSGNTLVRVAEYFELEEKTKTICLWADGSVTVKGSPEEKRYAGQKPQEERQTKIPRCIWRKMNGQKVLSTKEMPTKYVPIIRVVGNQWVLEGKLLVDGMVRPGKDAQRMYNYNAPLALNTRLPTPSGWTTMRDVRAGDWLLDESGHPVEVAGTSPVFIGRRCYRVEFDDGSHIIADAEHKWTVEERGLRKTATWDWSSKTITTQELQPRKHFIATPAPLDLPPIDLPIDPYVLGAWLGDGTTAEPKITAGANDVEEMRRCLAKSGYAISEPQFYRNATAATITVYGVRARFAQLGLLGNKHIPSLYLRASREQRLDLLRGLMDTDGCVTKAKNCVFTVGIPALAEGFAELLRSLGIKACAIQIEGRAALFPSGKTYERADYWRFSFSIGPEIAVFRMKRKADAQTAWRPTHSRRTKRYAIRTVTEIPSVPVKCVGIRSASHLFLAGESMVPTHNSAEIEMNALQPKAPITAMIDQIAGHEDRYRTANTVPYSYLPYNKVVDDAGQIVNVAPPSRVQPPVPPAAFIQAKIGADQDLKATMGQWGPALGEPSGEKSGKAINARKSESDVGSFHYVDNLARALRYAGAIALDMAAEIITTRRVVRILGEDGEPDHIVVDPDLPVPYQEEAGEDGKPVKVYNFALGKYEVVVSTGPSFTTRRAEAAEFLTSAMQSAKDPVSANVLTYLAMKNQDVAGAEEAVAMLKRMLPPQVQEEEQQGGEQVPPQVKAMVDQLKQAVGHTQGQLDAAKQALAERDQKLQGLQAEAKSKDRESLVKMYEVDARTLAEIAKAASEVEIAKAQAIIAASKQPDNPALAGVVPALDQVLADLNGKIELLAKSTLAIKGQLDNFEVAARMPAVPAGQQIQ